MSQIKLLQLDPNGLCNSGCWFCPVAYKENPDIARKDMPIETIKKILTELKSGMGDFVSLDFNFVYTAHYNEVLLYKHFNEFLSLLRELNLRTMILTNGIPLSKEKTDTISKYLDVVDLINFNVPSAKSDTWSIMTGKNEKIHSKVMENIKYAVDNLPSHMLSIQVNGINEMSLPENGGWMEPLPNMPKINLAVKDGDLATALKTFKELFPGINVFSNSGLVDRAGFLDKANVMTNIKAINKYNKKGESVIGCSNMGDRTETWLHINANGDVFICCNDYDFETTFGNINELTIKEIWESSNRKKMIKKSFQTLCTTCSNAIWG